jgi:hypothetical protein
MTLAKAGIWAGGASTARKRAARAFSGAGPPSDLRLKPDDAEVYPGVFFRKIVQISI